MICNFAPKSRVTLLYSNFAWFKRNFQISKPFYLLQITLKIELIYCGHLGGCVLFTSAKINLATSFGKRKKDKAFRRDELHRVMNYN